MKSSDSDKNYVYPIIVHQGDKKGFWTEFVDFNAFTQGDTLDELISNAEEAMLCHIEDEIKNGAVLPLPSDIQYIQTAKEDFVMLIQAEGKRRAY